MEPIPGSYSLDPRSYGSNPRTYRIYPIPDEPPIYVTTAYPLNPLVSSYRSMTHRMEKYLL